MKKGAVFGTDQGETILIMMKNGDDRIGVGD